MKLLDVASLKKSKHLPLELVHMRTLASSHTGEIICQLEDFSEILFWLIDAHGVIW